MRKPVLLFCHELFAPDFFALVLEHPVSVLFLTPIERILDSGELTELPYEDGNFIVLDVFDDVILACHRNILKPDKLVIGKLTEPGKETQIIWNDLTESDVVESLSHCMYKYLDLEATGDVSKY